MEVDIVIMYAHTSLLAGWFYRVKRRGLFVSLIRPEWRRLFRSGSHFGGGGGRVVPDSLISPICPRPPPPPLGLPLHSLAAGDGRSALNAAPAGPHRQHTRPCGAQGFRAGGGLGWVEKFQAENQMRQRVTPLPI